MAIAPMQKCDWSNPEVEGMDELARLRIPGPAASKPIPTYLHITYCLLPKIAAAES